MKFTIYKENVTGELGYGGIFISPNEKNGYRPYELFISSLAGCSGTILKNILNKKRLSFQKIDMEVTSIRNPDHANRFEQISLMAIVYSDEAAMTPQQAEKIVNLVIKNCGMIQSVIQSISISFTIKSLLLNGDHN